MQSDSDHGLSPFAVEVIQGLLAGAQPSKRAEIDEQALVRFACGCAGAEEQELVIDALTRSFELRLRLIDLRAEVAKLRSMPWSTVVTAHHRSVVFEALRQSAGDAIKSYGEIAQSLKRASASGAITASAGLEAVRRWVTASANPYEFALSRGGSQTEEDPLGRLSLESLPNGDLTARLEFTGDADWSGRNLCLQLLDPAGMSLELGTAAAAASIWRIDLPMLAQTLNLPVGPVPTGHFRVSVHGELAPARTLWAPVAGTRDEYASFVATAPTELSGQSLTFHLHPSGDTRAHMGHCTLEVFLETEPEELVLAEWPIESIRELVPLSAELPGLGTCEGLTPIGALRLRVRK